MTAAKIKDTNEAWDDRALGADEAYVAVADESEEAELDEALDLQSIYQAAMGPLA